MPIADLADWMEENSGPSVVWFVKRLSANDTLATGNHQAGPYIPKEFLFDMFPSLNRREQKNPDKFFDVHIDSHSGDTRKIRAIWYNNKFHEGGTRNEARITGWGGSESALLDPDSTGSLAVFAFHRDASGECFECHVWVCDDEVFADLIEERIGPVEPGKWRVWTADQAQQILFSCEQGSGSCWLERTQIPPLWLERFPSGLEIVKKTIELRPTHGVTVDVRLMKRRDCEFEMFRSVEQAVEMPLIKNGFATVEDFITRAQTILQRRKARSGRSLELHARMIFVEENLRENIDFQHQPESDAGKRPDFLFPNEAAYKNSEFLETNLRMLAVKTTCKDRWRQILNEADSIPQKHLLTLQEGVSESQFKEMTGANVRLVVPQPLISHYPKSIQPHLQTLESFIGDIRLLALSVANHQ